MPKIKVKPMPTKPKRPCRYSGCPNLTDNEVGQWQRFESRAGGRQFPHREGGWAG